MKTYIDLIPASGAARIVDPVHPTLTRLVLNVAVKHIPEISKEPNPRDQNTNTDVARTIKAAARDPHNTMFHVNNRGFLVVGRRVEILSDNTLRVHLDGNNKAVLYGLGDGGTTYECLRELMASPDRDVVGEKFITMEIIADLPDDDDMIHIYINQIVASRNTSVQVKEKSLSDHRGDFNFIKQNLQQEYVDLISFRENADGDYDIDDVRVLLTMWNLGIVPQIDHKVGVDRNCHGSNIWGQAKRIQQLFSNNLDSYSKFTSRTMNDGIKLHDYVGANLATLYNDGYKHRVKAGSCLQLFADHTPFKSDSSRTPFLKLKANYYPVKPLWFAVLGAFRCMIEVTPQGKFKWILPYDQLIEVFESVAHRMVQKARDFCDLAGAGTPLDIISRRGPGLWEELYAILDTAKRSYIAKKFAA